MIKVLILITTDRFSSPARLVVQNIEHIDHSRFTMLVGCTWQGGAASSEFFQELQRRDIPLQILSQRGSLDMSPILSAINLVRNEGIDLIETHGFKACFIGFFLKVFTRKPWITVMHGHTAENRKVKFYAWLELRLARYADRIVTVSEAMRRQLVTKGMPQQKTETIHNAIDPSQFIKLGVTINRARYGITDDDYLIGVIGRLSPEKGQDLFIAAFRQVVSRHSKAKALLLGEGPTEKSLRDLVQKHHLENHVIFAGYQPEIMAFYPLFDLIVMPSRSEGLPSVALEALYHRIPIVATNVGGTAEVIINEKTGLLVQPESPEQLSAAIIRMLNEKSLPMETTAAGYDLITEGFLPKVRVKAFTTLYENLGSKA